MSPGAARRDAGPQPAGTGARQAGAGLALGIDHVVQAGALASLVFSGPLVGAAAPAATLFLAASLLPTLLLAAGGRLPAPLMQRGQTATIAILLPAIAAAGASAATPEAATATALAILGGTAACIGAAYLLIAALDLGRLVRLMPYPVAAGFMAASGALLVLLALGFTLRGGGGTAAAASDPSELAAPALALAVAAGLGAAARRAPRWGLLAALLAIFLLAHATVAALDLSRATAEALGLVPKPATAPFTPPAAPQWPGAISFDRIDWPTVGQALPAMGAAVLVGILGGMLNVTGVELALGRDLPTRPAFLRMGLANLVLAPFGAPPGYVSAASSSAARSLGGRGRAPALIACGVLAAALVAMPHLVAALPPILSAGLLVHLGLVLLRRWFLDQRRLLDRAEWAVTGLIAAIGAVFGMVPAVAVGIVAASMIFAVNYARLRVVRDTSDLRSRRSRVDRGPVQSAWLDRHGGEVAVITLQGVLFFGSVEQVAREVAGRLEARRPARLILLDAGRIRGIDAAAIAALWKLDRRARERGGRLVLAGLPPAQAKMVAQAGLLAPETAFTAAASLDAALEDAEAALLHAAGIAEAGEDAASALARMLGRADLARALLDRMDRRDLPAGTVLIRAGDATEDIYFVDAGRLAVQAPAATGGGTANGPIRLRSLRAGAMVGEMASYAGLPRSADVVAETPAVVYRMRIDTLRALERDAPDLAAAWHKIIAAALAEKLHRTNSLLSEYT